MPLTYPLTPPSPFRVAKISFTGMSASSRNVSPFTFQTQQYNWPGQGWMASVECPPMVRADAEQVIAFLLAAQRGTFYFRDYSNSSPRGNVTGTLTVSSATANSTTLGISGATGSFAVGDWLQVGTSLYKVVQVNSSSSVDLFPALRASYTGGTSIVYSSPKGIFRLASAQTEWSIELAGIYGVAFSISEEIPQ
jgi:hypothetical protein